MNRKPQGGKIFEVPSPGRYKAMSFEYRDGEPGIARLIEDGLFTGLWLKDDGGRMTWTELLTTHEPLRGVKP